MNVVDSSGWLEYFADGPNAGDFAGPIADRANLIVPVITLYEVFKRSLQQQGEEAARVCVTPVQEGRVVGGQKARPDPNLLLGGQKARPDPNLLLSAIKAKPDSELPDKGMEPMR